MIKIRPPRLMGDVASSLSGSSFRKVYRDGRVTHSRRIMTLGQVLARPLSSLKPKTEPKPEPRT